MAPTPVSVGGQPVQLGPNRNGGVVVGDTTIAPGGSATIAGKVVAAGASFVVVDGTTLAPAPLAPTPVFIAGQPVQLRPNGGVVVGDTIIKPGSSVIIAGQVISAGAAFAIVDGTTITPPPRDPTPVSIAGQAIQIAPDGGVIVGDTTISPGNVATISSHIISAAGTLAVVDGSTLTPSPTSPTPISIANQPLYLLPSDGGLIIGGSTPTTMSPGSITTIAGQIISAGVSFAIVDGSTVTPPLASTTALSPLPFSIAGQPLYLLPSNKGLLISGPTPTTLPPGSSATIAGEIISAGASFAVIDGSTISYPPSKTANATASATGTAGFSGVIVGGLGGAGGGEDIGAREGEVIGGEGEGADVTSAAVGRVRFGLSLAVGVMFGIGLSGDLDMV